MAGKAQKFQNYPRIYDNGKFHNYLDDACLTPHTYKIPEKLMKDLIRSAILKARQKSSREFLAISLQATADEIEKIYKDKGRDLFTSFKVSYTDPAATAYQLSKKHYKEVGNELFRTKLLQKVRMNSGWFYQFLAQSCASHSKRFKDSSGLGTPQGDFNVVIESTDKNGVKKDLILYVSVKNRSNTVGGQDLPKAIHALEDAVSSDKNRVGLYCCIFGIAMEKGLRRMPGNREKKLHSENTEIWLSDYFWPFFSNYTYEEIMTLVLDVLIEDFKAAEADEAVTSALLPAELLEEFGAACRKASLLDENGNFDDPYKLVKFFCS